MCKYKQRGLIDYFDKQWNAFFLTHSSWSAFKIAGILVADGGLGLTSGLTEKKKKKRKKQAFTDYMPK